ncbi:DUF4145 domain-containing protein [Actibacterium ureilyticum]|uniref:DUF4145 domain-containing protein n=1 Tax=Actibacterium ureilyticum TaxID=1590614 RepID=UPI000BAB01CC|nr:DUF4145 domain-containing protein [Actibacterium ureilyticum]
MSSKRRILDRLPLTKAPCPRCKLEQNIVVKHCLEEEISHENTLLPTLVKRFALLECAGCNTLFQALGTERKGPLSISISPAKNLESIESTLHWEFFPEPQWRELPKWMSQVFAQKYEALYGLLVDTYGAANRDANILCAMGVRTCFDIVGELLGIDPELSFSDKIEALRREGHISPREKKVLKILVDTGSAAAHRGWEPDRNDLSALLDALETFLHHSIILPQDLDQLSVKIPARKTLQD